MVGKYMKIKKKTTENLEFKIIKILGDGAPISYI
jgi:hypothetical protein